MSKIRILKEYFLPDGSGKKYVALSGASTESKPVKAIYGTGSLFLESDTGDIYCYDETAGWTKIAELGGGS